MSKKPEDMTIEEIKEQLAIYNRLYYHKRNKDEAYMQKKRNLHKDTTRKTRSRSMKKLTISD